MHTPDFAPSRLGLGWAVFLGLWLVLVTWGAAKLELFAATPGLPSTSDSFSAGKRDHLYVFLSPECPCSKATLAELGRLASVHKGFDLTVVIDSAGMGAGAADSISASAAAIPHCAVASDRDGTLTASFGARTSGQALLYDSAGKLIFDGGITPGRGHEGDNVGLTMVELGVTDREVTTKHAAVFGCALPSPRASK